MPQKWHWSVALWGWSPHKQGHEVETFSHVITFDLCCYLNISNLIIPGENKDSERQKNEIPLKQFLHFYFHKTAYWKYGSKECDQTGTANMWVVTSHLYHCPISYPLSQKLKLTHSSIKHFPLQMKSELCSHYAVLYWEWQDQILWLEI